ncbi:hypothetical protein HDU98_002767 [Podochytrium sp. JEL0797]|nr:hypothetical protein HDU98_002767 [Podochytrium sp. JEL0797]
MIHPPPAITIPGAVLAQHDHRLTWSLIVKASPVMNLPPNSYFRNRAVWGRRFIAFYGITILSAVDLWLIVRNKFEAFGLRKIHMLWGLHFLKCYPTEPVGAACFDTTESTWRKYVKLAVRCFAEMDEIHWDDRFVNWDCQAPSCYVDGVDILVCESRPLDRGLFSHKFNHSGYRFQVVTAFGTSRIVHISGGAPCGDWPDLKMVRHCFLGELDDGERVAADEGYRGDDRVMTKLPAISQAHHDHNKNLKAMGARHETVNRRLKDFRVLAGMYRGPRDYITQIFQAVAQITNVKLRRQPLYDLLPKLK